MIRLNKIFPLFFLALLFFGFHLDLCAQMEEGLGALFTVEGFVILNNGDTLPGLIRWKIKYVENSPVEIKFTNKDGEAHDIKAGEIPEFGNYLKLGATDYDNPGDYELEIYESVHSFKSGTPVFLKRYVNGRIKIYQNRSSVQYGGVPANKITEIKGLSFSYVPGEGLYIGQSYRVSSRIVMGDFGNSNYFVSKDGGSIMKVGKSNYTDLFPELFEDCPAIREELDKNPELASFRYFIILAEVYNQLCTGNDRKRQN